jgi:hypothetical protein
VILSSDLAGVPIHLLSAPIPAGICTWTNRARLLISLSHFAYVKTINCFYLHPFALLSAVLYRGEISAERAQFMVRATCSKHSSRDIFHQHGMVGEDVEHVEALPDDVDDGLFERADVGCALEEGLLSPMAKTNEQSYYTLVSSRAAFAEFIDVMIHL